jgi:hypothetical protein
MTLTLLVVICYFSEIILYKIYLASSYVAIAWKIMIQYAFCKIICHYYIHFTCIHLLSFITSEEDECRPLAAADGGVPVLQAAEIYSPPANTSVHLPGAGCQGLCEPFS